MDIHASLQPPTRSSHNDALRSVSSPPTTKDPRLGKRPVRPTVDTLATPQTSRAPAQSPCRTSSANTNPNSALSPQFQSATTEELSSPPEAFVRAISDLVESAVALNQSKAEKEALEKDAAITRRYWQKAKTVQQFPASAEVFQQVIEADEASMDKAEAKLSQHLSLYRQLQESLKTACSQVLPRKETDSRLVNLESKFEQLGARPQGEAEPKDGQKLLKSLEFDNTRIMKIFSMLEQVKGTVADLAREIETVKQTQSAQSQETSQELDKDEALPPITSHDSQVNGRMSEANDHTSKRGEVQIDSDLVTYLDQRVASFEGRLRMVEDKCSAPSQSIPDWQIRAEAIKREVQDHTAQLQGIVDIQAMKDAFHMSQMDSIEKAIRKQDEKTNQLESSHSQISKTVAAQDEVLRKLSGGHLNVLQAQANREQEIHHFKTKLQGLAAGLQQQGVAKTQADNQFGASLNGLSTRVQQALSQCESLAKDRQWIYTLSVSVRSLENRYNNLTTENLAKHIIHAMQETYPSIGQVQDKLKELQSSFEKDISELNKKVDDLQPGSVDQALRLQIQDDVEKRFRELTPKIVEQQAPARQEIQELQNEHISLEKRLSELHEQIAQLPSIRLPENFNKLLGYIDTIDAKFNCQIANLENLATTTNEKLVRLDTLCGDLADLKEDMTDLGLAVGGLAKNVRNFKAECSQEECKKVQGRIEALEQFAHSEDISSLLDRLSRVETNLFEGVIVRGRSKSSEESLDCTSSSLEQRVRPSLKDVSPPPAAPQVPSTNIKPPGPQKIDKKRRRVSNLADDDGLFSFAASQTNSSVFTPSSTEDQPRTKKSKRKRKPHPFIQA